MPASRSLYEAMAKTINRHYNDCDFSVQAESLRRLVVDLCDDLKQDNIHFNREKFQDACFK